MIRAIVQARMGSSRLPGKVLMDLAGRPVLAWVIEALRDAEHIGQSVTVATTALAEDDLVEEWCEAQGVECHRGATDDVLSRFIGAIDAAHTQPDAVMRITADCPLHDPALLDLTAALFERGDFDYVSTVAPRSLPRGLDVEIVRTTTLRKLDGLASGVDRVHVTSYLHRARHDFAMAGFVVSPPSTELRVTLDTEEDAVLLRAVVEAFAGERPSWRDLVSLLRRRPDLVAINAGVQQKRVEDG